MLRNLPSENMVFDHKHYMKHMQDVEETQIITTLRQLFKAFDVNDSGCVGVVMPTRYSFVSSMSLKRQRHLTVPYQRRKHFQYSFLTIASHGRMIDLSELGSAFTTMTGLDADVEELNILLRTADLNKDGVVDFYEFATVMEAGTGVIRRIAASMRPQTEGANQKGAKTHPLTHARGVRGQMQKGPRRAGGRVNPMDFMKPRDAGAMRDDLVDQMTALCDAREASPPTPHPRRLTFQLWFFCSCFAQCVCFLRTRRELTKPRRTGMAGGTPAADPDKNGRHIWRSVLQSVAKYQPRPPPGLFHNGGYPTPFNTWQLYVNTWQLYEGGGVPHPQYSSRLLPCNFARFLVAKTPRKLLSLCSGRPFTM